MQKSQRFALSACRPLATLAVSITLLAGCSSVADMVGYDTHTLNLAAGESYQQVVQEARQKKAIDTTSATARRIQTVFNRLKPFANEANQTGVPFDWQLTVIRSDELNAWAMPGGKMAMYTGLVNKLRLSDAEIAARREAQEARGAQAWTPKSRERQVSFALRAYASLATSADKGAVRDKSKLGG